MGRGQPARPPEMWAGPLGEWQPMTEANRRVRPEWGKTESLHYKSDAFRVQGWLLYPHNFDPKQRYPMVVNVHGGPASAVTPSWPGEYSVPAALSRRSTRRRRNGSLR